jgi:hypothetical protein
MENENLTTTRFFSLLFLGSGLLGLMISAALSAHYVNTLPKRPDPQNLRMIPRDIDGYTVYQTDDENRTLDRAEFGSMGVFLLGIVVGLVYFQKWGLARAIESKEEDFAGEEG